MGMPMPSTPFGSLPERVFDWFSGRNERKHNERVAKEYATNAIQWKVEDAKKAGVHPLYALGAPSMSPPASSIGGGSNAYSDMGQDISRALSAGMPRQGQVSAFDAAVQELTLKKFGLENELLAAQIARMKQDVFSKPAVPNVTLPSGAGHFVPGQSSSAQKVQDEYGDIVENAYGLWRLGNDAWVNVKGWRDNQVAKFKAQGRYGRDGLLKRPERR